jgi:hypothetical protein
MMPKSRAMYWPWSVTSTLPGCMSAWKKPSRKTWVKKISTPARARRGTSTPRPGANPRVGKSGRPSIQVITMTSGVQ